MLVVVVAALVGCEDDRKSVPKSYALAPVGQGFNLNASDLRFILQQIKIAENHAAGGQLLGPGPNQVGSPLLPFGLRTVDGSFNNLEPGRHLYGAADRVFPRMTAPNFLPAETAPPQFGGQPTSYAQTRPRRPSTKWRAREPISRSSRTSP
jgi:hypothetical protein